MMQLLWIKVVDIIIDILPLVHHHLQDLHLPQRCLQCPHPRLSTINNPIPTRKDIVALLLLVPLCNYLFQRYLPRRVMDIYKVHHHLWILWALLLQRTLKVLLKVVAVEEVVVVEDQHQHHQVWIHPSHLMSNHRHIPMLCMVEFLPIIPLNPWQQPNNNWWQPHHRLINLVMVNLNSNNKYNMDSLNNK